MEEPPVLDPMPIPSAPTTPRESTTPRDIAAIPAPTTPRDVASSPREFDHERRRTIIIASPTRSANRPSPTADLTTLHTRSISENTKIMYSDRETESLKEIFAFLVKRHPKTLKVMFESRVVPSQEGIEGTVTMGLITGTIQRIVQHTLAQELAEEESLSEGRPSVKLCKEYLSRIGGNYLHLILHDFINLLTSADRKTSMEINPSFTDPVECDRNKALLIKRLTYLLDHITSKQAIDAMPVGIRVIVGCLHHHSKRPAEDIGNLILNRYLVPALLAPEDYGLLYGTSSLSAASADEVSSTIRLINKKKLSSITRRNLTLITRVLQLLTGDHNLSKKDEYLRSMNTFIESKKSLLLKYYADLALPPTTTVPTPLELNVVRMSELHVMHKVMAENKDTFMAMMLPPSEALEFGKMLDKLGSHHSKVSFSFLATADRKMVQGLLSERGGEEASFLQWVDKKKRNKVQKRLLIVTSHRLLSVKPGGKVAREAHLLDLQAVRSSSATEIELTFRGFSLQCSCDNVDEMINSIRRAHICSLNAIPESLKPTIDVTPASRLASILPPEESGCGGFVALYTAMCSFYALPVNTSLCWELENLDKQDKILDLSKFCEESQEDAFNSLGFLPIFHALRYNTYFRSFILKNAKLGPKEAAALGEALKLNSSLHQVILNNIQGKDIATAIVDNLAGNFGTQITHLDLATLQLEDKGVMALSECVMKLKQPLQELNLSNTGCTSKGLASLLSVLRGRNRLLRVNLNANRLGAEGTALVAALLEKSPDLQHLSLSNSGVAIRVLLEAINKTKIPLKSLDLSHNKFKGEDGAPLVELLETSAVLERLNLSGVGVPSSELERIFARISPESNLQVDLSNNGFTSSDGPALEKVIAHLNVREVDLSDNDLGHDGVAAVADGLRSNIHIQRLLINRCLKPGKSKRNAVQSLIKLINSENAITDLEFVAKAGGGLKADMMPLILALGTNASLASLDISGHLIGNKGAIALAKSLQTNTTLMSLSWDNNEIGVMGLKNVKYALSINKTLKHMPLPVGDLAEVAKETSSTDQKKLASLVAKIEARIIANQFN
eukprot:TRINITY_DN21870_c0_g1_i1.p1 TRINITY_DN21870_c0_g1~~TRINITY_DN21870_c0_g1_i1.p1  ORF type:complete len:1212 (+),score=320.20 TRINITY_DN21870_c0_g1_i1:423-3638(+)